MKTLLKSSYIFLLFFAITVSFSQEDENNDTLSKVFSNKENSMNVLSSYSSFIAIDASKVEVQNSIFIQQIGNKNTANTNIISSDASLNLIQNGDNNFVFVDKNAPIIQELILQDGSNNSIVDFNLKTNNSINNTFTQTGNNLNIISIGSNNLSKEMTVKQTGNSGSVIILNN